MNKCGWTVLLALVLGIFLTGNGLWAQGKFEVELQGGVWTLKPVLKYFADQPWQKANEQNYGVSLRFKPRNSFSLGLSYQRIGANYSYSFIQVDQDVALFYVNRQWIYVDWVEQEHENVNISGDMVLLDLRWEIKPSWRVHPYFTFGLGAVFPKVTDDYYSSMYYIDSRYNSYKQVMDEYFEGNFVDLQQPVLPVLELMFGLKAELIKKKLAIGFEGGFLDGLVYRGTLNYRF